MRYAWRMLDINRKTQLLIPTRLDNFNSLKCRVKSACLGQAQGPEKYGKRAQGHKWTPTRVWAS